MRILVIALDGATPELLFNNERLAGFRQLMEIGCYGEFELDGMNPRAALELGLRPTLVQAGKKMILVGLPPANRNGRRDPAKVIEIVSASQGHFEAFRRMLDSDDWDYFQFVEAGLQRLQAAPGPEGMRALGDYSLHLDEQLRETLELLKDDTVLLVLSGAVLRGSNGHGRAAKGAFIFAAASLPPLGEIQGLHQEDLAPTLLELGGFEVPKDVPGRSLVAGVTLGTGAGLGEDEEALLRERLSGLGYI